MLVIVDSPGNQITVPGKEKRINGIISRRETADLKNQTSFTRGRLDKFVKRGVYVFSINEMADRN